MAIREITSSEFESIVDKYSIREVCIENYFKNTHDILFPEVDIGIKTYCESSDRRVFALRFKNMSSQPISDQIVLRYNPVATIGRSCLFVKPDNVNQKRLDSILDGSEQIKFYFYDVNSPDSMIKMFKDADLSETVTPYENQTTNYDVVIVFETPEIRSHLQIIEDKYDKPYSPMEPETITSRKQKIVDKYISGLNYKHMLLIIILAAVVISFSMTFGVDDVDPQKSSESSTAPVMPISADINMGLQPPLMAGQYTRPMGSI